MPTGTNLLGLVKHTASTEAVYLGLVFDRPFAEPLPWMADDAADDPDMWATPEESRSSVVTLYRRVWAHSDATDLPSDDPAWWAACRDRHEQAARVAGGV